VSINGANRLGSNSLPECLVFGVRAGRAAAEFASEETVPRDRVATQANDERKRLEAFLNNIAGGRERISTIREEMQKTVEQSSGIYREGSGLEGAAVKLRELQERQQRITLDDRSHTFNTELTAALELSSMLDVAETIVQCALHRTESRGAHQRTDFPQRDDVNFLAHSLVYRNADGTSRVEYLPVKITRWPPGKRVYGEQPQETVAEPTQNATFKRVS
jgi:fumarate reductase flavoprotein subunit